MSEILLYFFLYIYKTKILFILDVKYQLPSLMECEDTEMEDLLDDILEQAKKFTSYTRKDGNSTPVQPPKSALTVLYRFVIF